MKNNDISHIKKYLLSNLIILFGYIFLYPLVTKYIEADIYGKYVFIYSLCAIIASLSSLGIKSPFRRNYFEIEKKNKFLLKKYLFSVQLFLFLFFLAIFLLCIFLNILFFKFSSFYYLLLSALLFGEFIKIYLIKLENNKQSGLFLNLNLFKYLIFFIVIFSLLPAGFKENSLIYGWFFSNFFIFFLVLTFQFINKELEFNFCKRTILDLLKLSLPNTPKIMVGNLNSKIDKILLSYLQNFSLTGIYSIGQSIAYSIFQITTSLDKIFVPQLYKYLFNNQRSKIGEYLLPYIFLITIISISVILLSNIFVKYYLNSEFHDSVNIIIIFSLYYYLLFFNKITNHQLLFKKKVWINTNIFLLNIVLNILLSIPLIIFYDIYGAAIATVLTSFLCLILSYFFAQKFANFIYPKKQVLTLIFILLVSVLFAFLFALFQDIFVIFYQIIIFVIIFGVLIVYGYKEGFFTNNNIKLLFFRLK